MTDISLFEAMQTQRAIRMFTDDPVPNDAIEKMVKAAIRAPSPGNRQGWHFLVIRDPEVKRRIGEYYWKTTEEERGEAPPDPERAASPLYRAADNLAQRIGEVPVLIMACVSASAEASSRGAITQGAAIYPAIQNLMLAARGLGLGTCLTTRHRRYEQEIKALLGIPENMETAALIPVGYPGGGEHFGGSRRKGVERVTSYDRWGNTSPPS